MTALLEMKQKLKNFYGQNEGYLTPIFKFALAFGYFWWIRTELGMMERLANPFVLIITALLCSILPSNAIMWIGFLFILGHCYAVGAAVAGFVAALLLLMVILGLRFSGKYNLIFPLTPLGVTCKLSALIPIGSGLLGNPVAAVPVGCSVVFYYLIEFIKEQEAILRSEDMEIQRALKLLMDGLVKNQDMWMFLITFVGVLLLVYLIRTRSFDYAWRVSIIVGAVVYLFMMLAGGLFLGLEVEMVFLAASTILSALIGVALEFFAFGGDYTRTEHLEYEDDDYFYYVKAVPKVSISTSKRKIKKINGVSQKTGEIPNLQEQEQPMPRQAAPQGAQVDFEKKLEESLKDL